MKKSLKLTVFSLFAIFAMCIFVKVPTEAANVSLKVGTDSFTISWDKPSVSSSYTFVGYLIKDDNDKTIWTSQNYNSNSATFKPGKGYVGYLRVYYVERSNSTGNAYSYWINSSYVNTAPVGMSSKNIGIRSVLGYIKEISLVANKPANATGVQFECYKGSKRAWIDNSTSYHPYKENTVYKYRARAYYKNSSSGKTYYGSWSGLKYFTFPSGTAKSKYYQKGFTLSLKRTPGVKYYKVYVAKSEKGKYRKVKTIRLTSKKKYTVRVTKNYKKGATNYFKIVPYIKVGSKLVKSEGISGGSIYVWK